MWSEFAADSGVETVYETVSWDNFVYGYLEFQQACMNTAFTILMEDVRGGRGLKGRNHSSTIEKCRIGVAPSCHS